jgi:hypothetical protein
VERDSAERDAVERDSAERDAVERGADGAPAVHRGATAGASWWVAPFPARLAGALGPAECVGPPAAVRAQRSAGSPLW